MVSFKIDGETEISKSGIVVFIKKDVGWFDISVNYTSLV